MKCNATLWLDGESFSLQAKSPKFRLYAPDTQNPAAEAWGIGKPRFTDNVAPFPELLTDPSAFHLKGVSCTKEEPPVGTLHVGAYRRMQVVSPYIYEGTVGQWCYVQTAAPLHHIKQGSNEWHNLYANQWGLDFSFPLIGPYAATLAYPRIFADSPGFEGSAINEMDWLRFKGSFRVWAMYIPPGSPTDVRYVPVWYQPWHCDGSGDVDSRSGGSTTWKYMTRTAGKLPQLSPLPFPEWDLLHPHNEPMVEGPPPP
jgi:hypothetical protein